MNEIGIGMFLEVLWVHMPDILLFKPAEVSCLIIVTSSCMSFVCAVVVEAGDDSPMVKTGMPRSSYATCTVQGPEGDSAENTLDSV